MIDSNVSHPASGAGHSPFQSAQSALNRKPLPGPTWAWAGLAVVAVLGLVYLVTSGPAEHVRPRHTPQAAGEGAEPEATTQALAPAAVSEPSPTPSAAPSAGAAPADAPAANAAAAPASTDSEAAKASAGTEAAKASADTEAAKPSDEAQLASAAPAGKKKKGPARRSGRKRATRTP